jgi:hypothetical protein
MVAFGTGQYCRFIEFCISYGKQVCFSEHDILHTAGLEIVLGWQQQPFQKAVFLTY